MMKRFLLIPLAAIAFSSGAFAQRALPSGEVRDNGDIVFGRGSNPIKIGKRLPSGQVDLSDLAATPSPTAPGGSLARMLTAPPVISDGTPATPSAQAAIDLAASTGRSVEIRENVQALTAPLAMRPGVVVRCARNGGVSRATTPIITFNTNLAHGAEMHGCIVDGLWNGTTPVDNSLAVENYGGGHDTKLTGNLFRNIRGSAIYQNATLRWLIAENTFVNVGNVGVAVNNDGAPFEHFGSILRNRFVNPNRHAVLTVKGSYITVEGNRTEDSATCGLTVNLSGPASAKVITSTGTPDFSNVRVGSYFITNGGLEYTVTSKQSATSLTGFQVSGTDPGAVTGAAACAGGGDQINMQSGTGNRIVNNVGLGGATTCYLMWDDGTYANDNGEIVSNRCERAGNAGVVIDGSGGKTRNTVIRGNTIINPGQNRAGSGVGFNVGVIVDSGATGTVIQDNVATDNQTTPSMEYGVRLRSTGGNTNVVGRNAVKGALNEGVGGGVNRVDIGAGWGTGATVTDLTYREDGITFTVNTGSAALAPGPTVTVVFRASPTGQTPQISLVMQDTQNAPYMQQAFPQGATLNTSAFAMIGFTPGASRAYKFFAKF